jgi:hypothetical protein
VQPFIDIISTTDSSSNPQLPLSINSLGNVKVGGESTRGGVQTPLNGEEFEEYEEYEDAEELEVLMMGHTLAGVTTLDEDFAPRTLTLSREISAATQCDSARESDAAVITDFTKKGTLYNFFFLGGGGGSSKSLTLEKYSTDSF